MPIPDAVIVICSRPESRRLPGKVFKQIAGVSALRHILTRTRSANIRTILAVPPLVATEYSHYAENGVEIVTGDADSPLHRMASVINRWESPPKFVIRITHDDILIDVETILELLTECDRQDAGYGISQGIVEGAGVEVIRSDNIISAARRVKFPTEYISYFVKGEGTPYPKIVKLKPRKSIQRPYRLTMDYPADAQVLEVVLRNVGANATLDRVCEFLDLNPYILNLNRLPEVTIYTCAYNAGKWIQSAMLSAYWACTASMEYIIVDDHSNDDTLLEITRTLQEDTRLILNDRNKGLASSCNIALSEARGKYVLRLDADDVILAGSINKMLRVAQEKNAAIVYPGYHEVNADGSVIKHECSPSIHHHAGCALMSRDFINEVKFKDELRHWDSLELYNRIKDRYPVAYLNEPCWLYRRHDKNLSTPSELREQEKKKIHGAS